MSKSDGVKDCVKWLEKRIKEKKKEIDKYKRNYFDESYFEISEKASLNEMISIKISLEKYYKKLKHEEQEVMNNYE